MHLHKDVPEEEIKKVFNEFTGTIKQLPPIRSAVKRQERFRKIYFINLIEINEKDVLFEVGCEAGTYIRKLIHDMGIRLKTGAHMQQLVRTKTGPFTNENWYTLHDLKDAYEYYKEGSEEQLRNIILPFEYTVSNSKKIWILDSTVDSLCHGSPLYNPGVSKLSDNIQRNDKVAILTLKNELVSLGTSQLDSKEILDNTKGIAAKLDAVFMPIATYEV